MQGYDPLLDSCSSRGAHRVQPVPPDFVDRRFLLVRLLFHNRLPSTARWTVAAPTMRIRPVITVLLVAATLPMPAQLLPSPGKSIPNLSAPLSVATMIKRQVS